MIKVLISAVTALSLYGASCDPQSIVSDVAKLRQKYEECRQGQSIVQGVDPKLYRQVQLEKGSLLREVKANRARIQILERELSQLQSKNVLLEKELSQRIQMPNAKTVTPSGVAAPARNVLSASAVSAKPLPDKPRPYEKTAESQSFPIVKMASAARALPTTEHSVQSPTVKKHSSAYRMNGDTAVYDAPNGQIVANWEDRRSFTAGEPSNGWIRITGYFVNRVWQSAGSNEHLWVKEGNVIRR